MGNKIPILAAQEQNAALINSNAVASTFARQAVVPYSDIDIMEQISSINMSRVTPEQLAREINRLTDILLTRANKRSVDPHIQIATRLAKMNVNQQVEFLTTLATQLPIREDGQQRLVNNVQGEKPLIRKIKQLANYISTALRSLYNSSTITPLNSIEAVSLLRYGLAPSLLTRSCFRFASNVKNVEIPQLAVNGVACLGITGYFLWMNPEIRTLLQQVVTTDFKNIKLHMHAYRIYNETITAMGDMYYGEFNSLLASEVSNISSILLSPITYGSWACESISYAARNDAVDVARTFVLWVQRKSEIITTIVDIIKTGLVNVATGATKVVKTVVKGVGHAGKIVGNVAYIAAEETLNAATRMLKLGYDSAAEFGGAIRDKLYSSESSALSFNNPIDNTLSYVPSSSMALEANNVLSIGELGKKKRYKHSKPRNTNARKQTTRKRLMK